MYLLRQKKGLGNIIAQKHQHNTHIHGKQLKRHRFNKLYHKKKKFKADHALDLVQRVRENTVVDEITINFTLRSKLVQHT